MNICRELLARQIDLVSSTHFSSGDIGRLILLLTYLQIRILALFRLFWLGSTTDHRSHTPITTPFHYPLSMNQQRFARVRAYVILILVCGFEHSDIRFLVISAFPMLEVVICLKIHGHVGTIISPNTQRRRPWTMVRDSSPNLSNQLLTSSLSPAPEWWEGLVNFIAKQYCRFNCQFFL